MVHKVPPNLTDFSYGTDEVSTRTVRIKPMGTFFISDNSAPEGTRKGTLLRLFTIVGSLILIGDLSQAATGRNR